MQKQSRKHYNHIPSLIKRKIAEKISSQAKFIILFSIVIISGCAAPSSTLVNERGEQRTCSAFGWGWLGTPMALATYSDCVAKMEAAGFRDVDDITKDPKVDKRIGQDTSQKVALRPVFSPGDSWTYKSTSPTAEMQSYSLTMKKKDLIRNSSVYVMEMSTGFSHIVDEDLNLLEIHKDGQVILENDPAIRLYSWPLRVGESWNTSGRRNSQQESGFKYDMDVKVMDYGYITVPAGRFEVFYITARGSQGGALASEIWYSPEIRKEVKTIHYFREGKVTAELTAYSR